MASIVSHPITLPTLTTLIGVGGFTVGVYSFLKPLSAAQVYGVSPDTPEVLKRGAKSSSATGSCIRDRWHESYVHALGIRNLTAGLSILLLTAHWRLAVATHVQEGKATQASLGIVITVGSFVPMVDAWVAWTAAEKYGNPNVGKRAGILHAFRSLVWVAGGLWCLLGCNTNL